MSIRQKNAQDCLEMFFPLDSFWNSIKVNDQKVPMVRGDPRVAG